MLKGPGAICLLALFSLVLPDAPARAKVNATVQNSRIPDALQQQNTLDLALKSISLSQGEGGIELWRLKAGWANIQQEGGKIVVQQPKLTYFMQEEGKILAVTSDTGFLDQKNQILSFNDNVRVTQDDKHIQGDRLVYNGTAKTMTFPQGGTFTGTGVSGSALSLVWHINQQSISAAGDVQVSFSGAMPAATPSQEENK